jgi:hypothetical protein
MKIRSVVLAALLFLVTVLAAWDQVALAKHQKLCFDCRLDGGCNPGWNCCIEIRCPDGAWYSCLGGGWK